MIFTLAIHCVAKIGQCTEVGIDCSNALLCSAKTGQGVPEIIKSCLGKTLRRCWEVKVDSYRVMMRYLYTYIYNYIYIYIYDHIYIYHTYIYIIYISYI